MITMITWYTDKTTWCSHPTSKGQTRVTLMQWPRKL